MQEIKDRAASIAGLALERDAIFLYDALAKIAVIKARRKGDGLSDAELMELVQALFRTVQPGTCPRGRRTYVEWTDADLTRRFG